MSYRGQVWVPPSNATLNNLNIVTGASITTVGSSKVLYAPGKSGDNFVGQYATAPATPYCAIFNISQNQGDYVSAAYAQQSMLCGAGFYDGTKIVGLFAVWSNNATMRLDVYEWSSVSAIASGVWGQSFSSGQPSANINWFMIRDDGTSIYFYIATDGMNGAPPTHWVKCYSQARTSYLANVNNVCWGCDTNGSSSDAPTYATLNSFQTVAL